MDGWTMVDLLMNMSDGWNMKLNKFMSQKYFFLSHSSSPPSLPPLPPLHLLPPPPPSPPPPPPPLPPPPPPPSPLPPPPPALPPPPHMHEQVVLGHVIVLSNHLSHRISPHKQAVPTLDTGGACMGGEMMM